MFRRIKNTVVGIDACKKTFRLSMTEYVRWFESLNFEKQIIVLAWVKDCVIKDDSIGTRNYIQATYGIEGWTWVYKRISEIIVETMFGKDKRINEIIVETINKALG